MKRPRAEIWDYFQSRKLGSTGHYRVKCYYYFIEQAKGETVKLEIYLGYECTRCPENVKEYWVAILLTNKIIINELHQPRGKRHKLI